MASRETGPSVPSPYDPGAGQSLPARSTPVGSRGSSPAVNGKPPWNSPPDAMSLLHALGKHWGKALLLGLFLGSLGAALTWFLYPKPKYRAAVAIHVQYETPTNLPGAVPITGNEPVAVYIQTERERFRLNTVLENAVRMLQRKALVSDSAEDAAQGEDFAGQVATAGGQSGSEAPDAKRENGEALTGPNSSRAKDYSAIFKGQIPTEWLKENLEVTNSGNIIWVALRSEHREGLDEVVNAVADAYISANIRELTDRRNEIGDLVNLGKKYETDLEAYRQTLARLTEQGQDPNDPRTFALTRQLGLERYADLQADYSKLKGELKRAEAQLAGLKARQKAPEQVTVSPHDIDEYFRSLAPVQALENEIADYDEQIERVRYTSRKDNDPAIERFQQQRRSALASLAKLEKEWRPKIEERLRKEMMTGGAEAASFANQIASLELEVKLLSEFKTEMELELQALENQNKAFSNSAAEMFKVQNDFKYADRAAERIRARLAELEVEAKAPARVRILDYAIPPTDRTDFKKKVASTVMAGGGMFMASLLMVAFLEFRTRRVNAPDEVVHRLGLSVVGTIPSLPDPKIRRPGNATQLTDSRWQQAFMESVDATRMLLLHMSRSENLRAVMITSANSGEGKTSLASYLGGSLARAVHRTLIVDCDLRRPAVNQVFDTPLEPGLCDLLRGEAEIQDIIRPTPIDGLFVIPAGRLDGRAMLSMGKGELGPILDWLKEQYDFVIVDAPPVLAVADTLQLSQHVDAVLFSILRDVSRMPEVYEARERLSTMNVRVLGAVMSGTPLVGFGYDRRYAYYSEKVST
jgi:succinoglycan biosynthesis transport protein ExoP